MELVLWSFQSNGGELYALSTGRLPPAEEHLLKDWKRLGTKIDSTEEEINRITSERPQDILGSIRRQGYHTLETKMLRAAWVRPKFQISMTLLSMR
jgi:hypothetical protein